MKNSIASIIAVTAFFIAITASTVVGEVRTWTQAASGKKLEGEFIKMKDEKTVIIKFGTAEKPVPIVMLSEEDQAFIKAQNDPAPAPAGDTAKPATPAKKGALPIGETTVILSGVHLCCRDCEELAEKSVDNDKIIFADKTAIKIEPNRKDKTITVTAPTGKEANIALAGLMQAGFYGKSNHDVVMIKDLKPDDFTSDIMSIRDVKACCGKSVKEIKKAVESVDGVKDAEVKDGSNGFKVTGEGFKPTSVMQALRDAGYGGSYR